MENFLNKLINPTVRTYGFKKKQFPASKTLRIRTKQQPYMLGIKRHYINKRRAQMLNENLFLRKTPARKESHVHFVLTCTNQKIFSILSLGNGAAFALE